MPVFKSFYICFLLVLAYAKLFGAQNATIPLNSTSLKSEKANGGRTGKSRSIYRGHEAVPFISADHKKEFWNQLYGKIGKIAFLANH